MTTSNQIALRAAKETERANRSNERIKDRDVREKERQGKFNRVRDTLKGIGGFMNKTQNTTNIDKATKFFGLENDPSWYNLDPNLVKDVASISFNTPLGYTVKSETGSRVVPGIMKIGFMPTIGISANSQLDNSVANIAAKNIYAYVRHANSGSRNYEAPDLLQYILGTDSCISFWAAMTRMYSTILTSKSENMYYYKQMTNALGIDYDDFINHIADLRAYINTFRVKLNSLYIPKDMTLYNRHAWLNSNIFKDMPIKKSSEYVLVQDRYFHYDDENGKLTTFFPSDKFANANILNAINFNDPDDLVTFDELVLYGNALINTLINSEDIGIMSGDILKAYGVDGVYYLPSIEENFHIESVYSEEVLSQITNGMLTNADTADSRFDINQSNGNIYQGEALYEYDQVSSTPKYYGIPADFGYLVEDDAGFMPLTNANYLVNMYKDDVSPDDVMVATRLKVGVATNLSIIHPTPSGSNRLSAIISCGTEVLTKAYIYTTPTGTPTASYAFLGVSSNAWDYWFSPYLTFDWAPVVYIFNKAVAADIAANHFRLQDYANYASISLTNLDNMHNVAVMSELGVPKLGLKVRSR